MTDRDTLYLAVVAASKRRSTIERYGGGRGSKQWAAAKREYDTLYARWSKRGAPVVTP